MPQTVPLDQTGLIWNVAPSFLVARLLTDDDSSVSSLSDPVVLANGPIGWLPAFKYKQIGLNMTYFDFNALGKS